MIQRMFKYIGKIWRRITISVRYRCDADTATKYRMGEIVWEIARLKRYLGEIKDTDKVYPSFDFMSRIDIDIKEDVILILERKIQVLKDELKSL